MIGLVLSNQYKMCVCRFEFSVSMVELHRRTLDVAVKNGGSILSKHKGLLGKVTPAGYGAAEPKKKSPKT